VGAIADDEPLGRLLAMALSAVIEELHQRLETAGWGPTRPLWGFVLLSIRDKPQSISGIGDLLGITKQAAAKVVDGLCTAGLARKDHDPDDRRATAITLTKRGARFLTAAESSYADIEAGWAATIGTPALATLRANLTTILHSHYGGQRPPLRPTL
jgi:DNA-binding MarR family transcriptional regulator